MKQSNRCVLFFAGVGPDGHCCSLFPGHPLLQEKQRLVVGITDSPKPPPSRITFTLPLIVAAHHLVYILVGENKADLALRVLAPASVLDAATFATRDKFPSVIAAKQQGRSVWFLDEPAASKLPH